MPTFGLSMLVKKPFFKASLIRISCEIFESSVNDFRGVISNLQPIQIKYEAPIHLTIWYAVSEALIIAPKPSDTNTPYARHPKAIPTAANLAERTSFVAANLSIIAVSTPGVTAKIDAAEMKANNKEKSCIIILG